MRKLLTVAVVWMMSLCMVAQERASSLTVQPKAGLNVSSMMGWNQVKVGYCFGAELEYQLTDGFSLSAAAIYSDQGGNDKSNNVVSTLDTDYLNVPVMASCYIFEGFALKAGVQVGFLLNGTLKSDGVKIDMDRNLPLYLKMSGDDVRLRKAVISVPVGISYEFRKIVLDARYYFGLTSYTSSSANPLRNNVFQLTLGYKF